MSNLAIPDSRLHITQDREPRTDGAYVLYVMHAARRPDYNFGLQHAVERARGMRLPLVILEPLGLEYPWASARSYQFALQGMAENAAWFSHKPVAYVPLIERERGKNERRLRERSDKAALVVTDLYPTHEGRSFNERLGEFASCRIEAVDSNGLLPLSEGKECPSAYVFRRHLQKTLPAHLPEQPLADPLKGARLASAPDPGLDAAAEIERALEELDRIDFPVDAPPVELPGGYKSARRRLTEFIAEDLASYGEDRNHPDADAASGLSPYLRHGQMSAFEIFASVAETEGWSPLRLAEKATGKRAGWWGMSAAAEAFLDEVITWRELGYSFCHHRDDYDTWESLPEWARVTLEEHAGDPRPALYERRDWVRAATHEPLLNAAQRELLREGQMQNYLRMLWGKKILEWSRSPREALQTAIEINNAYALDGGDPNSYSGVWWVFGRFDRAWGPERPVFGKVRFMSEQATRKKLRLEGYLKQYG